MSKLAGASGSVVPTDYVAQVCDRWKQALARYGEEFSDEEDYTYRAVLAAGGLFSGPVGSLEQCIEARNWLVRLLRQPWLHRQAHLFISLAVCDLAATLVEPSVYEAFCTALKQGPDFLNLNTAPRNNLLHALRESRLFPIYLSRDQKNLYIASLCRFVPAYKMRTEVLERLALALLRDLAEDWLRGRTVLDGPEFRERVSRLLGRQFTEQRVGDVLEPFCQLLRQIHQVFRLAQELEDFDECSPQAFSISFQRWRGEVPLAGQPLRLEAIWDDLRGLLGVEEAQIRTGPQGLLRRVRAGLVAAMPDGSPVPEWLADSSEDRVPWGSYPETGGRTLLVTAERMVNRFSLPLYETLLRLPLGPDGVGLDVHDGMHWLVADWPFQILGGPRSCPLWGIVEEDRVYRHVCRDTERPEYSVYGAGDEASRVPVVLDGTGRRAAPRTRLAWRLVETAEGPRLRVVVQVPAAPDEESVSIRHRNQVLDGLFVWEAGRSAAMPVPPEGELALTYQASGRTERVPFLFKAPLLFAPSPDAGIWWPLAPLDDVPMYERFLYLVGPANTHWQMRGLTAGSPTTLGPGWERYHVWRLERESRARLVRVGTASRTFWETEARPALALTASGADEARNNLLFYRDPNKVRLNVRGYLGRLATASELPRLRIAIDGKERWETVTTDPECNWSALLGHLLVGAGPAAGLLHRVTVTLQVPPGVERREPAALSFCSLPRLTARNEPRLRPGDPDFTVEVPVPPGSRLEYRPGAAPEWIAAPVVDGVARLVVRAGEAVRATRTVTLPLRIDGIPFRDVLTVGVEVTGLAVLIDGQEQSLASPDARASVDLKDRPRLEARGLQPGEVIGLAQTGEGQPLALLRPDCPRAALADLGLRCRTTRLTAWLETGDGGPRLPLGELQVEWSVTVDALEAILGTDAVEVTVKGRFPVDEVLLAVLIADGEELDEQLVEVQPGAEAHRARLELPEVGQRWEVVVRTAENPDLARCLLRGDPRALPPAEPQQQAPPSWEVDLPSSEARDTYLAELLHPTSGSAARSRQRQAAALIEAQADAGDLDWWRSGEKADRLRRLLERFRTLHITGGPLARGAFVAALAGCKVDRESHPELGPVARELLLRYPVLSAARPGDDILAVIKGTQILVGLLPQAESAEVGEWRALGVFFEKASLMIRHQVAGALKERLLEPMGPAPGMLALLLLVTGRNGRDFNAAERFLAADTVRRQPPERTAAFRRVLLRWVAGPFRSLVLDLHRRPPMVSRGMAVEAALFALARGANPESPAVQQALRALPAAQQRDIRAGVLDRLNPGTALDPVWFFDLFGSRDSTEAAAWLESFAEAMARGRPLPANLLKVLLERDSLDAVRDGLHRLTTDQGRHLAAAWLDARLDADTLLVLFSSPHSPPEVARWLEFVRERVTATQAMPDWFLALLDALDRCQAAPGPADVLARCVPPLVEVLRKAASQPREAARAQCQREGLARLLASRLPAVDPVHLELPVGYESLALPLVRLMVDDPDHRNSRMQECIDFYDDTFKRPGSPEDLAEMDQLRPALALLGAALRERLHQQEFGEEAFDLACSVHKYLGKWHYLLTLHEEPPSHALTAIRIYLAYLRLGRWENKTRDVWEKIQECLTRLGEADRPRASLECARLRVEQGFWRAAWWWLAMAAAQPAPATFQQEHLDGLAGGPSGDSEMAELAEAVRRTVKRLWKEHQNLDIQQRRRTDQQRWLSILLPALAKPPTLEIRQRMNAAVEAALKGSDIDEEFDALLEQPGIPPNYRYGSEQSGRDFVKLLLDGVQGEPRQRIIAWIIEGDAKAAEELRSTVSDGDIPGDVAFETRSLDFGGQ